MLPPAFVTPPPRASSHHPAAVRRVDVRSASPETAAERLGAGDLYSLRARRRFASYLRLRLLEMREANLERAAAVIERRLPIDALEPQERRPAGL